MIFKLLLVKRWTETFLIDFDWLIFFRFLLNELFFIKLTAVNDKFSSSISFSDKKKLNVYFSAQHNFWKLLKARNYKKPDSHSSLRLKIADFFRKSFDFNQKYKMVGLVYLVQFFRYALQNLSISKRSECEQIYGNQ